MLQGVKPKSTNGGCFLGADNAENAALLAQLVAVRVNERMGEVHQSLRDRQPRGSNGD
jgi:hypothetical protein